MENKETDGAAAPKRSLFQEYRWFIVFVLAIFIVRSSLINHYVVPSGSMEPTIQVRDRVFVDMTAYGVRVPFTSVVVFGRSSPEVGDIVLFSSPTDGTRLIKRVVGIGGQRIDLVNGQLSVEGKSLAQIDPSTRKVHEQLGTRKVLLDLSDGPGSDINGLVIPQGKVLVVGDHRGASLDGRFFGLVDEEQFYGRAVAIYWKSTKEGLSWDKL